MVLLVGSDTLPYVLGEIDGNFDIKTRSLSEALEVLKDYSTVECWGRDIMPAVNYFVSTGKQCIARTSQLATGDIIILALDNNHLGMYKVSFVLNRNIRDFRAWM